MTIAPEQSPTPDDDSGAGEERFDRRIAIGVVVGLAIVGAIGPFGWHFLSANNPASKAAGAAAGTLVGQSGGTGSNANAAVAPGAANSPNPATVNPATPNPAAANANTSCAAALGNATQVSTTTGTVSSIGGWALAATPSVKALRAEAANLHAIVIRQDTSAAPTSAESLCDQVGGVSRLPAMPDGVGASAWQGALSAYVAAASNALAAVNGSTGYWQDADAQLAQGGQELDALSARIITVTQR
jgi:hypothetical protein